MSARARAAFRLALRGMHIFPLAVGAKVPPAGSHGLLDASNDADVARARWAKQPSPNIGIATGAKSGVWVLDVDVQHDGPETLTTLEAEHGALPVTITASTPRGGRHYYFKWPVDGPEIRSSAGRIGAGLDGRGEGGYVVAPPSVLDAGRRYSWIRNGAHAFAEAPQWLIELALPPPLPPRAEPRPINGDVTRYVASAVAAELDGLDRSQPGQRNNALNVCAFKIGQFVGAGALPEDWAQAELERHAVGLGLTPSEIKRTIASGFRAGLRAPRELPHG